MKVKFLQDRKVQDAEGKVFKKDQVYDLSEASAQHWIARGVAVEAKEDPEEVKSKGVKK